MHSMTLTVKDKDGKELAYHTVLDEEHVGKLWRIYTSFGLTVEMKKKGTAS